MYLFDIDICLHAPKQGILTTNECFINTKPTHSLYLCCFKTIGC